MNEDRKKTLGEYLKSEREKRGFTIEQTSSATKIGLKILRQLEADQYVDLPALPFVRGFVRNYGKFLGLDGEKLLLEYTSFLEAHSSERPKRDAGHSGYAFERPEGEQSRKILWGVMAGMLIFGGAVVFLFKPSLKRKHHGHVEKLKPKGAEAESTEELPNPAPAASPLAALASPGPSPSHSGAPVVVAPSPVAASPSPIEAPFIPPKVPLVLAPSAPSPSPTSTPSPSPAVLTVLPLPTPSPSGVPSPLPSLSPEEDDLIKDPLQSGTKYSPKEIRYKLVIRTKADVWVRYQCDEKKVMRFSLKKDKILVLRGKNSVFFQVSNPDSITFKGPGHEEMFFSKLPGTFDFHGNLTVVYPTQPIEKVEEKFKIGSSLPPTESPVLAP